MASSFRKPYTVKIAATGTWLNGIFIPGTPTTSTIYASVQPLKPEDIQQLSEGRRNSKLFWIFTDTKLNDVTTKNPDKIVINGEDYEVDKIEAWQNEVISHYKVLVVKV